MSADPAANPDAALHYGPTEDHEDHRRAGRLEQDGVRCDLGKVIDLSATGMRIESRRGHQGVIVTRLTGDGCCIAVAGEVVWSRKISLFKHLLGIRFCEMEPEVTQHIVRMAMFNHKRRVID